MISKSLVRAQQGRNKEADLRGSPQQLLISASWWNQDVYRPKAVFFVE